MNLSDEERKQRNERLAKLFAIWSLEDQLTKEARQTTGDDTIQVSLSEETKRLRLDPQKREWIQKQVDLIEAEITKNGNKNNNKKV